MEKISFRKPTTSTRLPFPLILTSRIAKIAPGHLRVFPLVPRVAKAPRFKNPRLRKSPVIVSMAFAVEFPVASGIRHVIGIPYTTHAQEKRKRIHSTEVVHFPNPEIVGSWTGRAVEIELAAGSVVELLAEAGSVVGRIPGTGPLSCLRASIWTFHRARSGQLAAVHPSLLNPSVWNWTQAQAVARFGNSTSRSPC